MPSQDMEFVVCTGCIAFVCQMINLLTEETKYILPSQKVMGLFMVSCMITYV
uniref:Putative rhamnogalacturonate lyase B isoform X3 n=1 Tax=Rhizophora mucronata TaxID=61149 RepID=A0A2P2Q2P7_RHIMU